MKILNLIVFASRLNKQGELRQAHEELFSVLDRYFVSSARLIENTLSENVCRTQVRLRLDEPCSYFLDNPIANHHVLLHGEYAEIFREFFGASGVSGVV